MKHTLPLIGIVLVGALVGMLYWVGSLGAPESRSADAGRMATAVRLTEPAPVSKDAADRNQPVDPYVQQLAIDLLDAYGEDIHNRAVQARLLEVRDRVLASHPQDGQQLFELALFIAFPVYAQDILNTLAKLVQYQQWLEINYLALSDMSYLEREGAKWTKRLELFGTDAELIWADEKQAWAQRQQQVQQVIETLDQADHQTLDETLFQLRSSLDDAYGSGLGRVALDSGMVAQVYFGFESVQAKLRGMGPDQRQQQINRIRSQLGYSEDQVARLESRDQRRDQRWQNGLAYMQEREALAGRLTGQELDLALQELQERYFQHEAVTIAREEQDGFFRYQRPRFYGRN